MKRVTPYLRWRFLPDDDLAKVLAPGTTLSHPLVMTAVIIAPDTTGRWALLEQCWADDETGLEEWRILETAP